MNPRTRSSSCAAGRETYGYCCLTDQRTYYSENFPKIAVEKAGIDEVITMMVKGKDK